MAKLNGSLWKDSFMLHELTEIMRQKEDTDFAELLNRVRIGQCTEEDIDTLQSREISPDDPDYPDDALHVFAYNADVDTRNEKEVKQASTRPCTTDSNTSIG